MYASNSLDEKTFTLLYKYHYTDLRRIAYSILRDSIVAQEAIHNVFMRLWEKQDTLHIDNIVHYLSRAVRNESLSLIQASKRHRVNAEQEILASIGHPAHSAQQELEAQDCEKKLQYALQRLSPRQREAFVYARFMDMTHEEIGKTMGISRHTVNEYIQEAQKKVALHLADLLN